MELSRRELWTSLGASGLLLGLAPMVSADDPDSKLKEIEEQNVKFVTDFCAAWSTLDANKIAEFLSDKIVYQVIDGMPLIKGKEAFVKFVTPFLAKKQKAQWDISRSHAIGNIVINQRVDNFYSKSGTKDDHFNVIGLFILKDGKIVEWKDYRLPGEKEKKEEK